MPKPRHKIDPKQHPALANRVQVRAWWRWRHQHRHDLPSLRARPEYAVLDARDACVGPRTRELMRAYLCLHAARQPLGPVAAATLAVASRQPGTATWTRHPSLLQAVTPPTLAGLACWDASRLAQQRSPVRLPTARARVRALLLQGGMDAGTAEALLGHYSGFHASVAAGVARSVMLYLGPQRPGLLDNLGLCGLVEELCARGVLWTVDEVDAGQWPAGVHLFMACGGQGLGLARALV